MIKSKSSEKLIIKKDIDLNNEWNVFIFLFVYYIYFY
jgi:hypothetical protein